VRLPDWGALLLTMALASLVLAQFGVRAHLNHTYTATVLFVPLAATLPSFRRLWLALVSLLGVSHLLVYGFGRAILLPGGAADSYPAARPLVDQVASLPAYGGGDTILRVQAAANAVVTGGPNETIVSLLSPIVFVIACLMIRAVFREIQPALLHSAGGSAPALPDGGARKPA
jgi:hypothetical protein